MDSKKALIGAGTVAAVATGVWLTVSEPKEVPLTATKDQEAYKTTLQTCDSKGLNCRVLTKDEYMGLRAYYAGKVDATGHFTGSWQDLQTYIQLVNEDAKAKDEPVISGEFKDGVIIEKINERLKPKVIEVTPKEITK